jgi:hypothetical protein
MPERGPGGQGWTDRVRHWLWLDHPRRTDNSEADRGPYPGGMPIYPNRKPVGWRFALVMAVVGVVIALAIIAVRDAEAQPSGAGHRDHLEQQGLGVTLLVDVSGAG